MDLAKARPIGDPRFVLREEYPDTALVFDPDSGEQYVLNHVGALIWKLLNGRRTLAEITERLPVHCRDVPEAAGRQVADFVQTLRQKGLVRDARRPLETIDENPCDVFLPMDRKPHRMRTPRSVDVAITSRCNLRCAYCSHFSGPGDIDSDRSLSEWLAFFRELRRAAVTSVTLQGGEPFCRNDLQAIIDGIVNNRMRFSILSNGTLITAEMAAFLASTGRCNGVQVSIDGSRAAVHDPFRGRGSFAKAMDGVGHLQAAGLPVTVRVTIHRKNIGDLPAIARLLLKDCGLAAFSCNAAAHLGLCRENRDAVQLTAAERTRAMAILTELERRYPGRIQAAAGPLAEAARWREMMAARCQGRRSLPGGGYLTACNGPMQTIAVRADGVLIPCIQLSHLELGRINHVALAEIWQTHPTLERLRERQNTPLTSFAFCRDCEFLSYCTGNCPALAYTLTGNDQHPSPDACLRRFLAQGGHLPVREDSSRNFGDRR